MTTRNAATNDISPRFEDCYARAPFSELIRIVLTATEALVGHLGRPAHRSPALAPAPAPAPAARGAKQRA